MTSKRTDISRHILDVWSDALDRDIESVDSDFFSIGGDSFLAALVSGALSDEFEVDLSVSDLYSHRTVRQLADYLALLIGT